MPPAGSPCSPAVGVGGAPAPYRSGAGRAAVDLQRGQAAHQIQEVAGQPGERRVLVAVRRRVVMPTSAMKTGTRAAAAPAAGRCQSATRDAQQHHRRHDRGAHQRRQRPGDVPSSPPAPGPAVVASRPAGCRGHPGRTEPHDRRQHLRAQLRTHPCGRPHGEPVLRPGDRGAADTGRAEQQQRGEQRPTAVRRTTTPASTGRAAPPARRRARPRPAGAARAQQVAPHRGHRAEQPGVERARADRPDRRLTDAERVRRCPWRDPRRGAVARPAAGAARPPGTDDLLGGRPRGQDDAAAGPCRPRR